MLSSRLPLLRRVAPRLLRTGPCLATTCAPVPIAPRVVPFSYKSFSSSSSKPAEYTITPMTPEQLEVVKNTRAVVGANVQKIVADFYPRMLKNNPEVLEFFNVNNQRTGRQPQALAEAILAYASNIENLGALGGAVDRIAHKHCALNVRAEHYSIVHDNLMAAVANVLGEAVTPEIAGAWSAAVNFLGDILIKREAELYTESETVTGGWKGRRNFVVAEKNVESTRIASFKLKAEDGNPISAFKHGQYLSVASNPTSEPLLAPRHYTIINQPGDDFYEIGVRRHHFVEHASGVMSCWLHTLNVGDKVQLFPPFGVDTFEPKPDTEAIVLVSSGIGITQSLALLPDAVASEKPVIFCHADTNQSSHAFKDRVESQLEKGKGVYHYFYEENDNRMTRDSILGVVSKAKEDNIVDRIDPTKFQFYFCCCPETTENLIQDFQESVPLANLISAPFGPHIPHASDSVVLNV